MKNLSIIAVAVGIILTLCSCNAERKALDYAKSHPEKFAEFCADEFPVKDSVIVRDSISFDTLYSENEVYIRDTSYIEKEGRTITIYKEKRCPPTKTITKTVRHDSLVIRRDTAKETALQQERDAQVKRGDKLDRKYNWWMRACLITWLLVALYVLGRVFSARLPFKLH